MRSPGLPKATRHAIVRALKAGQKPVPIAQRLGCTVVQLYEVARAAKIRLRRTLAWDWEGRRVEPPREPESGLAKLLVHDPEGRIRDPQAGRTWQLDLVETHGWPSKGYGRSGRG